MKKQFLLVMLALFSLVPAVFAGEMTSFETVSSHGGAVECSLQELKNVQSVVETSGSILNKKSATTTAAE